MLPTVTDHRNYNRCCRRTSPTCVRRSAACPASLTPGAYETAVRTNLDAIRLISLLARLLRFDNARIIEAMSCQRAESKFFASPYW